MTIFIASCSWCESFAFRGQGASCVLPFPLLPLSPRAEEIHYWLSPPLTPYGSFARRKERNSLPRNTSIGVGFAGCLYSISSPIGRRKNLERYLPQVQKNRSVAQHTGKDAYSMCRKEGGILLSALCPAGPGCLCLARYFICRLLH